MTHGHPSRWKNPGAGVTRDGGSVRRIVVSFDEETFADIRTRALKMQMPFAYVVRELVEWGLQAEEDAA